ncbi:MAG: hypothetical protein K6E81_00120 [Lachnospiraceae bacterium]|nr:hypothetical protein [Lachnospiraceae bacterium]
MLDFDSLKKTYQNFSYPVASVKVNDKDIMANKKGIVVGDIEVENTCNFEASIATFRIYNAFDPSVTAFHFKAVKNYVAIGSTVTISMGYEPVLMEVFRGFISRVNFQYERDGIPAIVVTAMDIKGIMMANNYARQIKAEFYSDAVKKIFEQSAYKKLQSNGAIRKFEITDTPDKNAATTQSGEKTSDRTIEMVVESDYEFVVKAAKKYNYEFFSVGDVVYFRKAKDSKDVLMKISPSTGLRYFNVGYDITGLVGTIEVRNVDVGRAKVMSAKTKSSNKISKGNKAKALVSGQQKVYIDPTADSTDEIKHRMNYLMEDMAYRFGTLECEIFGLPDLIPGSFVELQGLGDGASNQFYITSVRHVMDGEHGFYTKLTGKAASVK